MHRSTSIIQLLIDRALLSQFHRRVQIEQVFGTLQVLIVFLLAGAVAAVSLAVVGL